MSIVPAPPIVGCECCPSLPGRRRKQERWHKGRCTLMEANCPAGRRWSRLGKGWFRSSLKLMPTLNGEL